MNYTQIKHYLYNVLPMFQQLGKKAFRPGLHNIRQLCNRLNNPEANLTCIHVAGTNGKGSTVHCIAAMLQHMGLKVGVYSSPHYNTWRERIKINGRYISKQAVVHFFNRYKSSIEELRVSFFELTTAMAFWYFHKQKVDVAIIETGVGGGLDATNIIRPVLTLITNVSFDHQALLGNTLKDIAAQKGGIIKANTPIIIGETQNEVKEIFQKIAATLQAPITFADQCWSCIEQRSNHKQQFMHLTHVHTSKNLHIYTDLLGAYQLKNIISSVQAIVLLQHILSIRISCQNIQHALTSVQISTNFKGRWQVLNHQNPHIIADSAHNVVGVRFTMQQLQQLSYQNLHIVWGVLKDKALHEMLVLLPQTAQYYFCEAPTKRALNAQQLTNYAQKLGLKGKAYTTVESALQAAKKNAATNDIIYIGGSSFIVAAVLNS